MTHLITQRGNRRQQTFFNEEDYAAYLELMAEWCREEGSVIQHERTGWVLGDEEFQKRLEKNLGRVLRRQKPGPKRRMSR
ncbi:MAG: hypothetical protein JXB10_08610 [Pirellulales bacterium]|nr:hypothetical protein [Pirellulales bacterium]